MSSRKNVFLSGLMAVVLAGVIIGASSLAGVLPMASHPTSGNNPGGTNPGLNNQGNNTGSTTPDVVEGTLSILVTDPPTLPDGVTGVQITYDSISVHSAQISTAGGWISLNATGTIDSLALINVGQTLISAQVPAGTYDFVRIHITAVHVTYNGTTYAATIANDLLTVAMEGGVSVNGTKSGAALVDLQPTVLNTGSSSSPQFVFNTVLQVYLIDPVNFSSSMEISGSKINLTVTTIMPNATVLSQPTLNVLQASLGVSSLSVTVKDTGSTTQDIRLIILKPIGVTVGPPANQPGYRLPAFADSIVFAVQADGSLKLVSMAQPVLAGSGNVTSVLQGSGFNLLSGSSVTFSYSGPLTLGNQTLIPTNYQISVVSDTSEVSFTVTLG